MDTLAWDTELSQKHFFPKLRIAYLFTFKKKKEV